MQLSAAELGIFRGVAQHFPEFITLLSQQRERERDVLEQGNSDIVRGRAILLRELLAQFEVARTRR